MTIAWNRAKITMYYYVLFRILSPGVPGQEGSGGGEKEQTGAEPEGRKGMRLPEEQFRANPDFVAREIAGEYILVPTGKTAESFNGLASLNASGAFLWKLLAQPRTARELSEALAAEYELTAEQSAGDVADFLHPALERRLLLRCGGEICE